MWKHTKEQVNDILITAVEGGVNYWARVSEYRHHDNTDKNGYAVLFEMDTDELEKVVKTHRVNHRVIRKGLKLASESEHEHIRFIAFSDILDANDADIVIQLGLFGEIVYG